MKANYNFEVIRNEKKQEKLKEVIKNFDLNNASMVILYRYYLMKLMPLFDGEIPDLSQRIDDDFCDAMAMETAGFDGTDMPTVTQEFCSKGCLSYKGLYNYGRTSGRLYGWNVQNVVPIDGTLQDLHVSRAPQSWRYCSLEV